MLRVGIRLRNILALNVQALESAGHGLVKHVGDAESRFLRERHTPQMLEHLASGVVADMAIAGILVRKRAHIARTLHVVLSAQRIHAHTFATDVSGSHGQVGHPHDHRGPLAVLGDAEAIVDGAIAGGSKQPRGGAHGSGGNTGGRFHGFRRVAVFGNEARPRFKRVQVAPLAHVVFLHQPFRDHHVGDGVNQCDVGARQQRQVMRSLDVRRTHQVDAARVGHDELRALPQPSLHPRRKHRMRIGGVGADQQDDISKRDGFEVLRAGGGAERVLEAVSRGRVADAGAGVDVIVAESGPYQLLYEEGFFVRAARRRDAAHSIASVGGLESLEFRRRIGERLLPGHYTPRIGYFLANHRRGHPVLVRGVPPGKPALHARVAFIRLALFPRHHAHHLVALGFRAKAAPHSAIGARCGRHTRWRALLDNRLLVERGGGTCLHTRAAGHALR